MRRYYFDLRDNDTFLPDEDGIELLSMEVVKNQAARVLFEIARGVIPGAEARTLTVEVRDDDGLVLKSTLRFEVEQVRQGK